MPTIYDKIQELQEKYNLSLYAIEKGAGIAPGTIKNWKKSSPSVDSATKVAYFFDVSVDYLLGITNNPLSHKNPNDLVLVIAKIEKKVKQLVSTSQQLQDDIQNILNSESIRMQLENLNILNDSEENSPTSP